MGIGAVEFKVPEDHVTDGVIDRDGTINAGVFAGPHPKRDGSLAETVDGGVHVPKAIVASAQPKGVSGFAYLARKGSGQIVWL